MNQMKKLATNAGAPVVDNQNTMTAGKRKLYKTKADTKGAQR
jgi:catalase